jgi:cellulose synthase/poly-beta-1,6-N-acetylglucosamine synthase-like glycosyltransferase
MNIQFLLYIFLGIILLLTYALSYLVYKIQKQNKLLNKPQEEYGNTLEIIEQAQKQANSIVERAVESAKHILFETEYIKQDITKEMQDSLQKVAEETVKMVQGRSTESEKEFRAVVDEIKADFAKEAEKKLSAIEQVTLQETSDFKEVLREETIKSQIIIGKKIGEDFNSVQNELIEYKKQKLSEIDKNIQIITKQVVEEVLGKSIPLPIQQELVISSLEKAKKTGLFRAIEEKNEQQNPIN